MTTEELLKVADAEVKSLVGEDADVSWRDNQVERSNIAARWVEIIMELNKIKPARQPKKAEPIDG